MAAARGIRETGGGAERLLGEVLARTFTKQECYARLNLLSAFFDHVRYGGARPDDLAHALAAFGGEGERERAEVLAAWGDEILDEALGLEGSAIQKLKDIIEALPALVLYVPTHLGSVSVEAVGTWCRREIAPDLMIDLMIDPAAAGGCLFVWQSKLHDYSLGYFVEKYAAPVRTLVDRVTAIPLTGKKS